MYRVSLLSAVVVIVDELDTGSARYCQRLLIDAFVSGGPFIGFDCYQIQHLQNVGTSSRAKFRFGSCFDCVSVHGVLLSPPILRKGSGETLLRDDGDY